MRSRATYKLEGDGLEILLVHDALESLRHRGRNLGTQASDLPNVAAILREATPLRVGLETCEYYEAPYHQWFTGTISAIANGAWTITYADNTTLVITDENEARRAIDVCACVPCLSGSLSLIHI